MAVNRANLNRTARCLNAYSAPYNALSKEARALVGLLMAEDEVALFPAVRPTYALVQWFHKNRILPQKR